MSKQETLCTLWGEFIDFLSCRAIENGACTQKKPKMRMEEILSGDSFL
jgi:hypothetical protein